MGTLTEFLLARIAEIENAAHYASGRPDVGDEAAGGWGGWWLGHYDHYSRYTPARALADCTAKRQVIDVISSWMGDGFPDDALSRPVLAALAAVYDDHPDYREEWRA